MTPVCNICNIITHYVWLNKINGQSFVACSRLHASNMSGIIFSFGYTPKHNELQMQIPDNLYIPEGKFVRYTKYDLRRDMKVSTSV